jgi:hypothetical protein
MSTSRRIEVMEPLTAADLLAREFPPLRYCVEGLIVEGLTLLAGKPKLGKSWLALLLSVAVAAGGYVLGQLRAERGEVLYLALEDGERRLQQRLRAVLGDDAIPDGWHYQTLWPTIEEEHGGLEALQMWLESHPACRLVIIDTLAKIRPRERPNATLYGQDYGALAPLAELARAYHVALVIVHHTRKAGAEDALDAVSGSTGLTAAADAVLVLQRARGQGDATLSVTGRDIEERELALRFDQTTMQWTLIGDAETLRREREQAAKRADDDWLRGALAGGQRWSTEVIESGKAAGIGRNRLFDAKERIGAKAVKVGRDRWDWKLDTAPTNGASHEPVPPPAGYGQNPSNGTHSSKPQACADCGRPVAIPGFPRCVRCEEVHQEKLGIGPPR